MDMLLLFYKQKNVSLIKIILSCISCSPIVNAAVFCYHVTAVSYEGNTITATSEVMYTLSKATRCS